jgi:hypothetical protein
LTDIVKLPLLWFSKECPSADINIMRPVPASHSMNGRPSASRCQTSRTFRPCRSSRLRRFAPHAAPQVCFTLQPAMGFEAFPVQSPFIRISAIVGPLCLSRTRSSYPPKCFPLQQPFCVTTFVSFSSLLPISVSSLRSRDLKAFLHCKVRRRPPILLSVLARYSLGLCSPSRFSPHTRMLS